jgi:hypothetical protein
MPRTWSFFNTFLKLFLILAPKVFLYLNTFVRSPREGAAFQLCRSPRERAATLLRWQWRKGGRGLPLPLEERQGCRSPDQGAAAGARTIFWKSVPAENPSLSLPVLFSFARDRVVAKPDAPHPLS